MAVAAATFSSAGRTTQHVIPGAYSRFDVVAGASGFVSTGNTVLIGSAQGGEPQRLLQFNNLSEAQNTLVGGPLYDAMRHAFNPGPGVRPQRIFAMRVNNASRSTFALQDASADIIALSSRGWGSNQNQIQVRAVAGATAPVALYDGRDISIRVRNQEEVFDNVERGIFTITGGVAADMVTITADEVELLLSGTTITLTYTDYDNVESLVSAMIAADTANVLTISAISGSEDIPLGEQNVLDHLVATPLGAGVIVVATANTREIIERINAESAFVTAELISGSAPARTIDPVVNYVFFTGGNNGDYNATQLTDSLTILEAEDIQFMTTPDPDDATAGVPSIPGIKTAIKDHCERQSSTTGRRERQFIVGGAWGESADDAITDARVLNSFLGMRIFNGFRERNSLGNIRNWGSSYTACRLAGMASVLAINEPLTFKAIQADSLESSLNNSTLELLIRNSVAPVAYDDEGVPIFVRQVNSYQRANKIYNEFSAIREALFASRDLRTFIQRRLTGRPGTDVTEGMINGLVLSRLGRYVELGIFIGDENSPAFENVTVQLLSDSYILDYDANLTLPVNNVFVTSHFREFISAVQTL